MKPRSGRLWLVCSGFLVFLLGGCWAGVALLPAPVPTPALPPTPTRPAWPTFTPTPSPVPRIPPTFTPSPENRLSPTPTPVGGGSGDLIFQRNFDVYTGRFTTLPMEIAYQARGSAQPGVLIATQAGIDGMDWSPDGKRLIFSTRNFLGVSQLFVVDVARDGINGLMNTQQLYTGPEGGTDPSWSPDGTQIAFLSGTAETGNLRLCMMNSDGRNTRCLVENFGRIADPDWAPDGQSIVFSANYFGNFHLYTVNLRGDPPLRLTDPLAGAYSPQFSPAGDWIVYSTDLDGNAEIYRIRPDGTDNTRLTNDPAADSTPAWSPDGQWISFFRQLPASRSTTLCTLPASGGRLSCRADFPPGTNLYPRWRPAITTLLRQRRPMADLSGPDLRP
ncbi:periplasmic component of the Tol biopolymer transport system [Longilinea arvoryzae]|uniref:Periplasmic component of the Tol biopolymer transport system n=1 Tax=Longilinea arvoryzae TaxID=360412 RepID=A0A0K8MYC2_9CHLR|nr:PD40 domain-containing protein [Longilinea arvoryzae]GAP16041.1 periplasmic component of the Tol biopolymer transport system [Longilinea arvoryzae]